jgi:hypothetical protein
MVPPQIMVPQIMVPQIMVPQIVVPHIVALQIVAPPIVAQLTDPGISPAPPSLLRFRTPPSPPPIDKFPTSWRKV